MRDVAYKRCRKQPWRRRCGRDAINTTPLTVEMIFPEIASGRVRHFRNNGISGSSGRGESFWPMTPMLNVPLQPTLHTKA